MKVNELMSILSQYDGDAKITIVGEVMEDDDIGTAVPFTQYRGNKSLPPGVAKSSAKECILYFKEI